jgi:small subunit ribosomal protein S10
VNLPIAQERDYVHASEEEWHASLVHGRSSLIPHQHKPIYRIPAATLHLRSHHQKLLDFYAHFVSHAAASLGIPISRVVHLPTQRSLWTVPRSPFAHKKSQENFERRTHKRAIKAWDADPEVVDRWFQYIRQHAMGGVGMRALRWSRMPLGVGATHLQQVKQALTTPQAQMKKLADKIVKEEAKKSTAAAPTQAS